MSADTPRSLARYAGKLGERLGRVRAYYDADRLVLKAMVRVLKVDGKGFAYRELQVLHDAIALRSEKWSKP